MPPRAPIIGVHEVPNGKIELKRTQHKGELRMSATLKTPQYTRKVWLSKEPSDREQEIRDAFELNVLVVFGTDFRRVLLAGALIEPESARLVCSSLRRSARMTVVSGRSLVPLRRGGTGCSAAYSAYASTKQHVDGCGSIEDIGYKA